MGGIFRKIKRRLGKTQKWVMGEKIVFDEGKQRVKQQENVDIQRTIPLPIYIGTVSYTHLQQMVDPGRVQ